MSEVYEAPEVIVENLSFSYSENQQVIRNISLKLEKGNFGALIGPSGSGKSTLVSLILGLYSPDKGRVTIAGEEASKYVAKNPGLVAYVPQNFYVVNGTMAENVALGYAKQEIDRERVHELLLAVGLFEDMPSLSQGIDTKLDQNQLSGGQLQRLGIARALYRKPKFLVLDEPTSSQDADNEQNIFQLIRKLNKNLTLLVVAHRLSTIQSADQIFVIESGRVSNSGSFSELQKNSELVARQSRLLGLDKLDRG